MHLTGPTSIPQSPTHALILLHGFGDEGASWLSLAHILRPMLPAPLNESLALFAPNGPMVTPSGQGYQWFKDAGWTFRDAPGLAHTTRSLEDYLNAITSQHGIPSSRMVLLGFSQGAMATLYATPRLKEPVAAQISIAGMLSVPDAHTNANPTPTLFLHGEADDVLPADKSVEAASLYQSWNIPTETTLLPDLGHGVDANALAHISVFLQEHLK